MKYLCLLLPALLLAAPAVAQRGTVFGVYDPDAFIEGNATRFLGCHDGHAFHADGCPVRVDTLRAGEALHGVDGSGRLATVLIERVNARTGDLYEAPYAVSARESDGPVAAPPMLLWQVRRQVLPLQPREVALDSAGLAILRAQALVLHRRAEALRSRDERSDSLVLGTPVARTVEGEERMAVYWPAALAYGPDKDERASLFFIYDPDSRRIVSGRFGHPEWAPLKDRDDVSVVEPLLFFRVRGDGRIYMLARDNGPWEHIGFGVFELHSGDRILRSR